MFALIVGYQYRMGFVAEAPDTIQTIIDGFLLDPVSMETNFLISDVLVKQDDVAIRVGDDQTRGAGPTLVCFGRHLDVFTF